jgi:hypothetical protein
MTPSQVDLFKPEYGPSLYIDQSIDEENLPEEVNLRIISENLKRDFPEITQDDWDNCVVYLTDKLHDRYGGVTINTLAFRNSVVARSLFNLYERFRKDHVETPTANWLIDHALGREVLTVINVRPDWHTSPHGLFFDTQNPITYSGVLAHELHHATGQLQANRVLRSEIHRTKSTMNRLASGLGMAATVMTVTTGGLIAGGYNAYPPSSNEPFAISMAIAFGGLALALGGGYNIGKLSLASDDQLGFMPAGNYEYGYGEVSADAYAFGLRDRWEGAIKTA